MPDKHHEDIPERYRTFIPDAFLGQLPKVIPNHFSNIHTEV